MGDFLDQPIGDMSLSDLQALVRRLIHQEVPPIPAALSTLSDLDSPIIQPDQAGDQHVLVYDKELGRWVNKTIDGASITPGEITETEIADNSISTPKLQANSVDASRIAAGGIGGGNRLSDSSFEQANQGNQIGGATKTWDTTKARTGTHSIKLVTPGSAAGEGYRYASDAAAVPVTPGGQMVFSAYAQGSSGTVQARAICRTSGNVTTGGQQLGDPVTLDPNTWETRAFVAFDVPTDATHVILDVVTDTAQAITFWVDDLQLESGSIPTTWTPWNITTGITADNLAATLVLASLVKTATGGRRVEFDSSGIRLYDTDGTTLLANFPTTGDEPFVEAVLSARGLDIDAAGMTPTDENRVRWVRDSDGALIAVMYGGNNVGNSVAELRAVKDDSAMLFLAAGTETGDEQALLDIEDNPALTAGKRFVKATVTDDDGSGTTSTTVISSDGKSDFVRVSNGPAIYALEIVGVTWDVPNEVAHTGEEIVVSIPGLQVGDYCFWGGNDGLARQFIFSTLPVCTTAGQITVKVYNANNAGINPASCTHYFIVFHRS